MENKTPWTKFYGAIREKLDYPDTSISGAVFSATEKHPDSTALIYMGRRISFRELSQRIIDFSRTFSFLNIAKGERVAVCLPNIPEAVYSLYGLNRMGAVASFLHPLSAPAELDYYIEELGARYIVTLDSLYKKFSLQTRERKDITFLVVTAGDSLPFIKRSAYCLKNMNNSDTRIYSDNVLKFSKLEKEATKAEALCEKVNCEDTAVVLFSGGTTGISKGVMLSNLNLNAMAVQTAEMSGCDVCGKSMLAAMPMFHGFGLAVCVHTPLISGACSILVPRFTMVEYAKLIKKYRPNFIAGVPTLFEALTSNAYLDNVKLDCLLGVFSGGDTLSVALKKKFDGYLKGHGAEVKIREGYGCTECVTACCLTPVDFEKEGSIGIPFPDMRFKICAENSTEELPYGTDGEICISGPTLMKGYLNHQKESEEALKRHDDGYTWLHTGDVGMMDEDGFIYFRRRIKRVIVTSGYNVYPSQIEKVLELHPSVKQSCVVGVSDSYRMKRIKAYVVTKDDVFDEEKLRGELFEHLKLNVARYAMPKEIEFLRSLPRTAVGKVDYTLLEIQSEKE